MNAGGQCRFAVMGTWECRRGVRLRFRLSCEQKELRSVLAYEVPAEDQLIHWGPWDKKVVYSLSPKRSTKLNWRLSVANSLAAAME